MQKVRSHPEGLLLFVCMRFQNLFHSPPGVLFAFPSQYLFAIGRSRVFSLGGWSPRLQPGFHVPRPTCRTLSTLTPVSRTGPSPSAADLSRSFRCRCQYLVRAAARSLAATGAISVDFFSCSYLDVSVRRVRLRALWIHARIMLKHGVPSFGHPRIKARCQLPGAFRRLPRPSSPVIAKASTTCTWSLDPITLQPSRRTGRQTTCNVSLVLSVLLRFRLRNLAKNFVNAITTHVLNCVPPALIKPAATFRTCLFFLIVKELLFRLSTNDKCGHLALAGRRSLKRR